MKKTLLLLVLAIVTIGLCSGCADDGSKGTAETNVLSINDIKSDPFSFTGEIVINGVATAFSQEDMTLFGIMDTAELMACRNLNCGAFALSAKYTGDKPMPEIADVVDFTGRFVQTESDYYFEIMEFEVKRNILKLMTNTTGGL